MAMRRFLGGPDARQLVRQFTRTLEFSRQLASKSSAGGPAQSDHSRKPAASTPKPAGMSADSTRLTRSQTSKSVRNNPSSSEVKHDERSKRFTLDLGHNKSARIDYKPIGANKIEMYHTEVPVELRGLGLGKTLAKGALENAARNNMKVKLTCTYLIDFGKNCVDSRIKSIITSD